MASQAAQLPTLSGALGSIAHTPPSAEPPRRASAPLPSSETLDWQLVTMLRRRAAEQLGAVTTAWLAERGTTMPTQDRRVQGGAIVRSVVRAHAADLSSEGRELWPLELERRYASAVENGIFGYGRLQPLFEIEDAENIEIHGYDSVVVQYDDGRRLEHERVADSDEELIEAIRFLGERATPPRPFDDAHPTMTLALGSRFRVHAIAFGLAYRPSIVIRQHRYTDVTLSDLAEDAMLPPDLARMLQAAVLARKSMVISGDQGAGKTTLLRALVAAIHPNERFGTLETDYELLTHLRPERRNILALQARTGLGEQRDGRGLGEYTVADLFPEALRQNLTRLVVGEVRGAEAGAMLESMASGAGTLSTTHSHSAASTIDRLASRVAQGGVISVAEAMRQIAHNVHFLIHVTLDDDTWRGGVRRRYVSEVRQLTGAMEGARPTTHLVYRAGTPTSPELFAPDAQTAAELARYEVRMPWAQR